jgi:hypothetical protein
MDCQDATAHVADYLAGSLPASTLDALRAHAASCAACREELRTAEEMWTQLRDIPADVPDRAGMTARFDEMLPRPAKAGRHDISTRGLAAAAVLVLGIFIGRHTASPAAPPPDTHVATLRSELGELKQMMALSLLQQQSATARLQGVVSTGQIADPNADVIAALLDALAYDANANVRLASIDALERFMDRDLVKRRTLEALPRQTSPLVQIALIDFVAESAGAESAAALRTLSERTDAADAVKARAAERLRQLGGRS